MFYSKLTAAALVALGVGAFGGGDALAHERHYDKGYHNSYVFKHGRLHHIHKKHHHRKHHRKSRGRISISTPHFEIIKSFGSRPHYGYRDRHLKRHYRHVRRHRH